MAHWLITELDSTEEVQTWQLHGGYTHPEIHKILQRLACTKLNADEVLNSSRRRNDPKRLTFLEPNSKAPIIDYGEGYYFTAEWVE